MKYAIKAVAHDQFGIVAGSGWAIVDAKGRRLDWPMLTTREEALADLCGFRRMEKELAQEEASERFGFEMMGAA
jgi:hypothetical protein